MIEGRRMDWAIALAPQNVNQFEARREAAKDRSETQAPEERAA
jgi:hypothetical protein